MNETSDHASPSRLRKEPYWTALFVAWVVSLPVTNILDNEISRFLWGHNATSALTILSMFAILPAGIVAAFLPRRWWVGSIVGGVCSPAAVVAKAVQIVRREMAKPENQRRAKELLAKVTQRRRATT